MSLWKYALILAGLAMLGPFSTDTYFPFFPDMQRAFAISATVLQQSLSVYLLSFSAMMLVHGALSDAYGRRTVILWSLAGYVLSSLGCVLAPNYTTFIVFRALQGMCVGAGMVVGQAVIRDCFEGVQAQKLVSQITMIFGLAPALAPLVGGTLHAFFPWQSTFVLLTGLGALCWLVCVYHLPESLPPAQRQPFDLRYLTRSYAAVVSHLPFMMLTCALGLGFSGFLIYVASAPDFVFHVLMRDAMSFGWLFMPIVIGLMAGSMLAAMLAGKVSHGRLLLAGYAVMGVAAACNVAYTCAASVPGLWGLILPVWLYTLGLALTIPSLTILALDIFPEKRGIAASIQGVTESLLFMLMAAAVSPLLFGVASKYAVVMAVLFGLNLCCLGIYSRLKRVQE